MKKEMDLKRYEQVAGREALKQMLDGEHAYFISLSGGVTSFFFDNNDQLKGETEAGEIFKPEVTVTEIIERYNWYVKKPFDVRAEMLARPNEWVGAFKGDDGKWHKVALNTKYMKGIETPFSLTEKVDYEQASVGPLTYEEVEKCIPIEDVPQEEWR